MNSSTSQQPDTSSVERLAEQRTRRARWRWPWAALAPLAAAGLMWLWAVDPAESSFYPRCSLHWLTGLHCPGCGATRALHAILHGDLPAAFGYNALLVTGVPAAALFLGWRRYNSGQWNCPAPLGWIVLAVLVAFGLARNLPCHPFDRLAPHRSQASSSQATASEPSLSLSAIESSR